MFDKFVTAATVVLPEAVVRRRRATLVLQPHLQKEENEQASARRLWVMEKVKLAFPDALNAILYSAL